MITGDQIRQARELLGWHRGQIVIRARGITGNTVGKAEGAYAGEPPTPEQLAEIRAVLEAAGVEFTNGDEPGVKPRATKAGKPKWATSAGNVGPSLRTLSPTESPGRPPTRAAIPEPPGPGTPPAGRPIIGSRRSDGPDL